MQTFKIDGKAKELKLTWKGVSYLNTVYEGGSMEVIGNALQGDLNLFPHLIFASLLHTGEVTLKDVENSIEQAFEAEELDMAEVFRLSNVLVAENFFYRKTVANLLKDNPEAVEALAKLVGADTE